ncbi:MAG: ribonuclease HII [candidate division SR1 bacterium]|nr:ribonuclease HII [candidate division SR1 bacterium]
MRIFIDEAGRGPLAGPLYVGVVKEDKNWDFDTVDQDFQDSKALTEKKRFHSYELLSQMRAKGLQCATGQASAAEIDRFGVTRAINMAIIRGLYQIFSPFIGDQKTKKSKKQTFDQVRALLSDYLQKQDFSLLIDGKTDFGLMHDLQIPVDTIIKGDAKIRGIAMASILAKVERDQFMISLAKNYPERDFDQHKGYGTQKHYLKIAQFGTCSQHRKLFLKQIFPSLTFEKFDGKILFTEKPLE